MKRLTALLLAMLMVGLLSVSLIGCDTGPSPAEDVYESPTDDLNED